MTEYAFITDPHFNSHSNVRTGDYTQDLLDKLEDVVEKCNQWDATLLIGGDIFDKPSVPDFVKTWVTRTLNKLNKRPFGIPGNHDILFDSLEKSDKTSLQVLFETGVIRRLTNEQFEDHILTSQTPVVYNDKPQIVVFHGFLNQQDGRNTFSFGDIQADSEALVLLGHDHVHYEDVRYKSTTIKRIGSFTRGIRNDDQMRIPQMLRIRVNNGKIATKLYPIKCKSPENLFKTKKVKPVQDTSGNNYSAIIEQIRKSTSKELALEEAFALICDDNTLGFIKEKLMDIKNKKLNK